MTTNSVAGKQGLTRDEVIAFIESKGGVERDSNLYSIANTYWYSIMKETVLANGKLYPFDSLSISTDPFGNTTLVYTETIL